MVRASTTIGLALAAMAMIGGTAGAAERDSVAVRYPANSEQRQTVTTRHKGTSHNAAVTTENTVTTEKKDPYYNLDHFPTTGD